MIFQTFKNLELMRHHLANKFEKSIAEHTDKSTESNEQILAGVFSSALSLLFTYILNEKLVSLTLCFIWQKILYSIVIVICFLVLFSIIFYGFKRVYKKICKAINDAKIQSPDYSPKNIKMIIDDFDIIAFDNLLASFEFIEHIENENKELVTFYFHELIYYLKIAIIKTKAVIDSSDKTINSNCKIDAIDLFRVYNAYSMMTQIVDVINNIIPISSDKSANENIKINIYDEKLWEILKEQIKDIKDDIDNIGKHCGDILNKHYKIKP